VRRRPGDQRLADLSVMAERICDAPEPPAVLAGLLRQLQLGLPRQKHIRRPECLH
jgi:hypothetical protein